MAQTKLGNTVVETSGELPEIGTKIHFTLTARDLSEKSSVDFEGKNLILNIFPSIDTGVCATSVREFNKRAAQLKDSLVLCISRDLPFAQSRFCGAEGIANVVMLSEFRNDTFSKSSGLWLETGAFKGLMARAILVVDASGTLIYRELVPAIDQEPDYESAIRSVTH